MLKNLYLGLTAAFIALVAAPPARADYSNTVMSLKAVAYWPLNETTQPTLPLDLRAANLGSAGKAGDGYYGAWYQISGTQWYLTNNILQTTGVTYAVDGNAALLCQRQLGQYVIVPRNTNGVANPAVTVTAPFSVEAWVRPGQVNTISTMVVGQQADVNYGDDPSHPYVGPNKGWAGFALGQYSDYIYFMLGNTNGFQNKTSEIDSGSSGKGGLKVGQWMHVVATFDGTTSSLYTNGVLARSKTAPLNAAGLAFVPDPVTPLTIGTSDSPSLRGVSSNAFCDVAIYSQALNASSVLTHYEAAYGTNGTYGNNYTNAVLADQPVLYYRLGDAQSRVNAGYNASTFPVATNYGSLGVAANAVYQPGTTPGLAGPPYSGFGASSRAVSLNGWLGAVDVGGGSLPAQLNPTGYQPFSVVGWFEAAPADAAARVQSIIGHGNNSYRLNLTTNAAENTFNPGAGADVQFDNTAEVITNGWGLNDGNWHMVAGICDGTNESLYLDGLLVKSATNLSGINIAGTNLDLLLGGDAQLTAPSPTVSSTLRTFDGQLAQMAFFTNALSASQVQQLFDAAGNVPPILHSQPTIVFANIGTNLTLSPRFSGSALSYNWYRGDGTPVSGQHSASLTFNPAALSDSGSYYVVASNAGGAVTSAVMSVTVNGPPSFTQTLQPQLRVFAGTTPTLQVAVMGPSPFAYQWLKAGVAIAGATNASYTLSATPGTYTYSVTVTNAYGSTNASTTVTVLAAPTQPYPAAVLAAHPIAFWRLDENDSSSTVAYDYAGGYNGTYTNLGAAFGQPVLQGYNGTTDPSETAPAFGQSGVNSRVCNVPTALNFGASTNTPTAFSIELWLLNYTSQQNEGGLVSLGYGNGGEQFCLDLGSKYGNYAYYGGVNAPRFFVRDATGASHAAAGTSKANPSDGRWHHVVAVCDQPNGKLYLYFDGALNASGIIGTNAGVLSSPMSIDIGARLGSVADVNYTNQFSGLMDQVAIYNYALSPSTIQTHYYQAGVAPSITQQPADTNANLGGDASFSVVASGTPPLSYQWFDGYGNPVPNGTDATVVVHNVSGDNNYKVTVSNAYGSVDSAYAYLSVIGGAPQLAADIAPLQQTVWQSDPVSFAVTVQGATPLYYQWTLNGNNIAGATGSSYAFAALAGTNSYAVTVTNSSGSVSSSTATVIGQPATLVNSSNFTSNMKITFSGYTNGETLANFPVLVRLSPSLTNFSYAQFASPTGDDIRFASSTGRELPCQIEQWNPSGESLVWVQVPSITSPTNAIWAYWGNSAATGRQASNTNGAVWSSLSGTTEFDLVWHLDESGLPYADSTLQYPGLAGIAPTAAPGLVSTGALFSATNYLDAGVINFSNAFTISAWVNQRAGSVGNQMIWANKVNGFNGNGFGLYVNTYSAPPTADGAVRLDSGNGATGDSSYTAAGTLSQGQWHLVSAVLTPATHSARLYVDGVDRTVQGKLNAAGLGLTNNVRLGATTTGVALFDGLIDEARIEDGARSANWVWASWATVASSTFASYSPVTSSVVAPVQLHYQVVGQSLVLTWSQGTLQSATSVRGPYADVQGATSGYSVPLTGSSRFFRVKVQ